MEKEIKYRYAVTGPNDDLVNIKDVTEECRVNKYRCVGCNRPMSFVIPKIHPEHQKFFKHQNKCYCNTNIYLHALAEKKIKARFDDKSRPFLIRVPQKFECSTHCELFNESCLIEKKSNPIDLHQYYDTCSLEKREYDENGITYYIADLKLHHSERPNRKRVLIEVFVTHENSESKRNSGLAIIEVNINKKISEGEKDIENFCSRKIIEEDSHFNEKQREVWDIRMDGFNPARGEKPLDIRPIVRVLLLSSGEFTFKELTCDYLHKSLNEFQTIYEFNMICEELEKSGFNDFAYIHLKSKGYATFRDCTQCNHYRKIEDDTICSKYETTYAPKHPIKKDATYCPYFELAEVIKDKYNNTTCQFVEVSKDTEFINTKLTDKLKEEKWNDIINDEKWRRRIEEKYEEIKRLKEQEKKEKQEKLNNYIEQNLRKDMPKAVPPKIIQETTTDHYILCPTPDSLFYDEDSMLENYFNRLKPNTRYFDNGPVKKLVLDIKYLKKSKCIYLLSSIENGGYYAIYKITYKQKFIHRELCNSSDFEYINTKFKRIVF